MQDLREERVWPHFMCLALVLTSFAEQMVVQNAWPVAQYAIESILHLQQLAVFDADVVPNSEPGFRTHLLGGNGRCQEVHKFIVKLPEVHH